MNLSSKGGRKLKKDKKTLSYYTARKLDFALFLTMSVGIIYMLVVSLCGYTISYAVGVFLCAVALFSAGAEFFFKKDKDDELAKYNMGIAHEKLSKAIPWFIVIVPVIFFAFFRHKNISADGFEILLIVILQPSLYLTVEQGLFLFIHGRETKDAGDETDE